MLLRPRTFGGLKPNRCLLSVVSPARPPCAGVSEKPKVLRVVGAFLFLLGANELASNVASRYADVGLFYIPVSLLAPFFRPEL
jgi:hypothetical protein